MESCNTQKDGKNVYNYGFVILFEWDPDLASPFKLFPREELSDMKDEYLTKKLGLEGRRRVFKFAALEGIETSVFVKLEKCKFSTYCQQKFIGIASILLYL